MTDREVHRVKDLGPLQELLLKAAPEGEGGKKPSIVTLAHALGIAHWAIYVWIRRKRVPAGRVKRIVEIGDGRVAKEDFHPYTFV